jgi:hypothetical protein
LAHIRETLDTYSERCGRPPEAVRRWFRRLTEPQQDRALRNIEVVNARKAQGIVGPDEIRAPGLILLGGA